MEKMNLKEARVLKARLAKKLDALVEKRENVAVVTIMPEENPREFIDITVDELTQKIDECIERLIVVGNAIRCANVGILEKPQGEDIASLVERAILLRKEAGRCKVLGERNPKKRQRDYGSDGAQLVDVTTYDIGKYAKRARDLVDKAEALSARIDRLDIETIVET